MRGGRAFKVVVGAVSVIVLILVLAQIFLPGIAAEKLEEKVERYGKVISASVKAFPAIELAWKKADSANVKISTITVTPRQAVDLLEEAKGVDKLDMTMKGLTISEPQSGGPPVRISLSGVVVHKKGSAITGTGELANAQLAKALPGGFEATAVPNGQGKLELKLKGGFIFSGSEKAFIDGHKGKIIAEFAESPGESIELFSDRRVFVGPIGASVHSQSTSLSLSATLH
jgi:hypothetical protein